MDPHDVIREPRITERTVNLSYGDPTASDETVKRKYTFVVHPKANKVQIKQAIEEIYNAGKKDKDDLIKVDSVRTINVRGKRRRVGARTPGKRADFKKAVVTLAPGQMLEDYGV